MTTHTRLQRIERTLMELAGAITIPRLALTQREAAHALGVSEDSIDRLTKRGLLKPSRAIGRPMYQVSEIETMLRKTTV